MTKLSDEGNGYIGLIFYINNLSNLNLHLCLWYRRIPSSSSDPCMDWRKHGPQPLLYVYFHSNFAVTDSFHWFAQRTMRFRFYEIHAWTHSEWEAIFCETPRRRITETLRVLPYGRAKDHHTHKATVKAYHLLPPSWHTRWSEILLLNPILPIVSWHNTLPAVSSLLAHHTQGSRQLLPSIELAPLISPMLFIFPLTFWPHTNFGNFSSMIVSTKTSC